MNNPTYTEIIVQLYQISPGPFQKRTNFDPGKLTELAESIAERELINFPIVIEAGDGYKLISGERRWRAMGALVLRKDGWSLPEAILIAASEEPFAGHRHLLTDYITVRLASGSREQLQAIAAVDNLQRDDLTPIEEAQEYQALVDSLEDIKAVARATSKRVGHIKHSLRLLELPPEIQEFIAKGELQRNIRVIRSLLSIPDEYLRLKVARRAARLGSTINSIEASCRRAVELLAQARTVTRETSPLVPIEKVAVVQRPRPVANGVSKPQQHFCSPCTTLLQIIAEELCGECLTKGTSMECLTCPGLLDLVEHLRRLVEHSHETASPEVAA